MATKKFFQIVSVESNGNPIILHPETNADYILSGLTYKVPTILNIEDWISKSEEITAARGGKANLKAKVDEIDLKLTPQKLLEAIKGVDGTGSGLDADTVDGKTVNDLDITNTSLWTAEKIVSELDKKAENSLIVATAQPNKVLKLNSNSKLQADVEGNSSTATALKAAVRYNFQEDVEGFFIVKGNEGSPQNVSLKVKDDSHNHTNLTKGTSAIELTNSDILLFKRDTNTLSKIDSSGNFTGSAAKVNNYGVNDNVNTGALWTNDKITTEISQAVKEIMSTTSVNEAKGSIIIGGVIQIRYGSVSLAGKTEASVVFQEPFKTKVLFDGYSIATSDSTLVCYKRPDSISRTGISYDLNKSSEGGTLTWFAVGI